MPIQDPSFSGTRKASYDTAENELGNTEAVTVGYRKTEGTVFHQFNAASPTTSFPSKRRSSWCTRPKIYAAAAVTIVVLLLIIILPSVLIQKPSGLEIDGVLFTQVRPVSGESFHGVLNQLYSHDNDTDTRLTKRSVHMLPVFNKTLDGNFSQNAFSVIDNTETSVHYSPEYLFMNDLAAILMKATGQSQLCALFICRHVTIEDFSLTNNSVSLKFAVGLKAQKSSLLIEKQLAENITNTVRDEFASSFEQSFTPNLTLAQTDVVIAYGPLCEAWSVTCNWNPVNSNWLPARIEEMVNATIVNETMTSEFASRNDSNNATSEDTTPSAPKELTAVDFRPPMANCSSYGFQCANLKEKVATRQRCDGLTDCSDGSDEEACRECVSSLKCPINAQVVMCLRGHQLCDGKRDCPTGYDESPQFCKKRCIPGLEYKCKTADVCIPNSYLCDGDAHCPGGDDELHCNSVTGCHNNAFLCKKEAKCVPAWSRCDGIKDCSDGSDEFECGCLECSGTNAVLCHNNGGTCIHRKQVCNGIADCPDGEDEQNCPGWCALEQPVETVKCKDNKFYPKRYACGGKIENCESSCDVCDPEIAFQCSVSKACISRTKLCDGVPHCSDGSDESASICACNAINTFSCSGATRRCIAPSKVCDGFSDCINGEDEKDCSDCHNNPMAFYCASTMTCLTSLQRCDGTVDCPDYSDENNCTCTDCKSHHGFQTYLCRKEQRCLHQSYICNQLSDYHCPGVPPEDLEFCPGKFDLHFN